MSHGITEADAMFTVRRPAWHNLGHTFENHPSRTEAQTLVHPWEPISEPLYREIPFIGDNGEPAVRYEPVPTLGNFRSDINDSSGYLGPISESYEVVTNNDMWDVAEALQGSGVDVKFETGGSIRGGKSVWLLLTLDQPLVLKGGNGATLPYYLLQNSHDGSGAFRGSATTVKVVCQNTLHLADQDARATGAEFTFRHTGSVSERIDEARDALSGWRESLEAWQAINQLLLDTKVSPRGEREFIERFIPAPLSTMTSERTKANIETAREQWWDTYGSQTCDGITGTAYGLLMASSEWNEHIRRAQSQESRFRRAMLDSNAVISIAQDLALEAALV